MTVLPLVLLLLGSRLRGAGREDNDDMTPPLSSSAKKPATGGNIHTPHNLKGEANDEYFEAGVSGAWDPDAAVAAEAAEAIEAKKK